MARKLNYKDAAGDMAKAQLQKIELYAQKLNDMIHPDDELESWVQSKLSRISTDIGDVKHYLDYELKKMGNGGEAEFADFELNKYRIAIRYDEDDDIQRLVTIHASNEEEAKQIAEAKYSPYYEYFEIVDVEQLKYGGEITALEMLSARSIVGEETWNKLSRLDKKKLTEHLINKGWIEEEEVEEDDDDDFDMSDDDDDLLGMENIPSMEESAAMKEEVEGKTIVDNFRTSYDGFVDRINFLKTENTATTTTTTNRNYLLYRKGGKAK